MQFFTEAHNSPKKWLAGVHDPSTLDHVDDRPPASQLGYRNPMEKARAENNWIFNNELESFQRSSVFSSGFRNPEQRKKLIHQNNANSGSDGRK